MKFVYFIQFSNFSVLTDWNSVFFSLYANFTIRQCVQHSVFLLYRMGFRLKMVFALSYMFPIDIMLTEFAIQPFTRCIVVVG